MGSDSDSVGVRSELDASGADGAYAYFALACAITWPLALPAALAWMKHLPPPPYAVVCAGLSAFGPLFAVLAIAGPHRQLRSVFGRWRTPVFWILLALITPALIHALATALDAAIGGKPAHWFHPPANAAQVAALIVFPLGEEFGWRGFAHARLVKAHGLVKGSLIVGLAWGLWHLMYAITPQAARFDVFEFAMIMIELPLYSLIIAWLFEHASRSMAVAIAFHAGGHLDHIEMAPRSEWVLHVLHLVVVAVAAVFAARALAQREFRLNVSSGRRLSS
jgi:membrane protease YdiL (CAAX protease family)